ncbi:hypothetical protein ARSEF1564_009953 [Beauveria bassiana]
MKRFATLLLAAPVAWALQVRQLYQFPDASQFLENIALLQSGNLILSTFDHARVYAMDPNDEDPIPDILVQVPDSTATTGIAEVADNVFAISAGNLNRSTSSFESGSAKIALITLPGGCYGAAASVKVVAQLPDAGLLNGMAVLPKHRDVVLSVDSKTGQVFRIDTKTGQVDIAFQDEHLTPGANPPPTAIGVNGAKIFHGYLYVTNSQTMAVGRFKIDEYGNKSGEFELVASLALSNPDAVPDDFALAKDGTLYVALPPTSLAKVTPDGQPSVFVNGSSAGAFLYSPSSAAFSFDEKTLFITTSGTGSGKGGQILAIDM